MWGEIAALGAGSAIGALGAQSAANTEAAASQYAADTQYKMWSAEQAEQKPYREAGVQALGDIQKNMPDWNKPFTMQDFQNNMDPGYQWRLGQGQQAIQQSNAASRGLVNAGTLASLGNYSQGAASQEYQSAFDRYQQQINNSYNRLASVAGLGQTATQNSNAASMNAANQIGQSAIGMGQAQAAGQVGVANAFTGAIGQGLNYYQGQQLLGALGGNRSVSQAGSVGGLSGLDNQINNLPHLQQPSMGYEVPKEIF